MTTDLSTTLQDQKPIRTIDSIQQEATQVKIPPQAKRISVGSRDAALYLSFTGSEGVAPNGTDCAFIVANNYLSMEIPHQINEFFVSTIEDTTTTIILILE